MSLISPVVLASLASLVLLVAGCAAPPDVAGADASTGTAASPGPLLGLPTGSPTAAPPPRSSTPPVPPPTQQATQAAAWVVGARPLPLRPDGYGEVLPTPPVLADRRLATADLLPAPPTAEFTATVSAVPGAVLARSTWHPGCPVRADELRYLTVSFWGFDGRHHTGELLANVAAAGRLVEAFRALHAARFPIEEMRVTTAAELTAAPTGDGNNTQAFVCRPVNGRPEWSAHARGLALDLNPFCNPYRRNDLVLPELASAYVDRTWLRPGMVLAGDVAVRAFARIGWSWGGAWIGARDPMHFAAVTG